MKFSEIKNALKHLAKTSSCLHCKAKYELDDINVVATTKTEGLFEMQCTNCKTSTIVTVLLAPEIEVKNQNSQNSQRQHQGIQEISENDVLDIKNFLNKFDGNFKRIFTSEK